MSDLLNGPLNAPPGYAYTATRRLSLLIRLADACYALDRALYERRRAFWQQVRRLSTVPQSASDWLWSWIYLWHIPTIGLQVRNQPLMFRMHARQALRGFQQSLALLRKSFPKTR